MKPGNKNAKLNAVKPVRRVNLGTKTPVSAVSVQNGNKIGVSLKTAEAISKDSSHPNRAEVYELLKTFERGWIDAGKFNALLSKLI